MNKSDLKELMALLPSNITKSKEFTTKTKMVIAQLILMNGMDKVKNDGYFFVTNKKLVDELDITEKTIIKIMRNLEEHNFITRKAGKRGEASEYIVNEEIIKSFGNTVKKHCNTVKENTVINYSNNLESTVINYSNKINDLILIINDLTKSNQELIDKVNQLEITVLNYSNKIENYSTDTESDKDKEIEKDKDIENINYNINKNNILNKIEEKENNITKEKEINVPLEQYNEIDLNNKIHNSKFEIKEVNPVGDEKKDMLLQSILSFKSSLENYKDNKPLAISIANGFYNRNKSSIEELNLISIWNEVLEIINNIPTEEHNTPTLDDEEDETYHFLDERSEFDKKLDAYARQVATGRLNFSTIM